MKCSKKWMAAVLSASMVLSGMSGMALNSVTADAAAKKATLKLNKTSASIKKGKTTTLKVKTKNVKKVKSLKWTTKNKKIATVTQKGVVKGVKAGSTTIKVKFKYLAKGAKKYKSKTLSCKVTVKAASSAAATTEPDASATDAPAASADTTATAAPTASADTTATPEATATPTEGSTATARPETTAIPYSDNYGKSKNGITMYDDGVMDETLTASQLIKNMGQGWNLGNTLESCGIDEDAEETATVNDYETLWGQPTTTVNMMTALKNSGFDTIRIPVAWSNMMSDDGTYTIDDAYFDRVETVMNYCFRNNMYVVLNIHYDSGWWGMFGSSDESVREEAWKKYEAIWTQIADRYAEYGDYLIFESANEELGLDINDSNLGLNTAVDGVEGVLTEDEAYEVTNKINQTFVDIVRASGGNNTYRQLLIAGFNTDLEKTCDDRYIMPTDLEENGKTKLSVSIHYYSPSEYCISEDKTSETRYSDSWGTEQDYADMHTMMDSLKKFSDEGYGIIFGEYGPQAMDKQGIAAFIKEVMLYSQEIGACPILWNNSLFDRYDCVICYTDIAEVLAEVTNAQNIPLEVGASATGTASGQIVEDDTLTLVAAWEGAWSRTNNVGILSDGSPNTEAGEVGQFVTTSCDDGLTLESNAYFWQLFFTYDWDSLNAPCIRITMADGDESDFQFAYTTDLYTNASHFDTMANEEYNGKAILLNKTKLAAKPCIELSSPTPGATIAKIEIYDQVSE
ncbi:MAG: cellulase family glycosylhydrolase [Clostridiaceae bacterium]|nr:cellulase family glycosylhydrolase [Clostridiaceae bacterium]